MFDKFYRRFKASILGMRGLSLCLLQAPLLISLPIALIQGRPAKLIALIATIAPLSYSAVLTQRYFKDCQQQYLKTGKAFSPLDHRKHALGFTALGAFILIAFILRRPPMVALISSALAGLGYYLRYIAADKPLSDYADIEKSPNTHLNPVLREMIESAYKNIEQLEDHARYLHQYPSHNTLSKKLQLIARKARNIISIIHEDSEKVRQARTFFIVYLEQLRDISTRYVAQLALNQPEQAQRQSFELLAEQMLLSFQEQQISLTNAHQVQLDIRMQVLREQLKSANNTNTSNEQK